MGKVGAAVSTVAKWLWCQFMALMQLVGRAIRVLMLPEGRKAWALVALWGAGVAMTTYAVRAQWFVRNHPDYSFWLGVLAHVSIMIVITGYAGLLVKRSIRGKITGIAEFGVDDDEAEAKPESVTKTTTVVQTSENKQE